MGIWLKRSLLCLWLLAVIIFAVLYFWSVAIAEALVAPILAARGGTLELDAIHLRLEGVEVELGSYEETALAVEGLTVLCPWSQLFSLREGVGGQLHFEEIRVRLDTSGDSEAAGAMAPAAQVEALAAQIDALPLREVEVQVDRLSIETGGQVFRTGLTLSLLRGGSGETHLTGALEGGGIDLDVRVKVLAGGVGLALDFVGTASDWATVQSRYLSALSMKLKAAQAELYLSPLGEGRGFLDVSGYARWAAGQADKLSFTALADLGASELYLPTGEVMMPGASFGLASDGMGILHIYGKGALNSVRYGSWMQSGGDWALRVDGDRGAAELRLGDGLSLSLGHEDWHQALSGYGAVRAYLQADAVDAEWLRVLPIPGVPDDLELDMGLRLDGRGTLKDFQLETATADADFEVRHAALASMGLTLRQLVAQVSGEAREGRFRLNTLESKVAELSVFGFGFNDLAIATEGRDDGTYATQPVRVGFMGGTLRIEPATIDPANLNALSLRADVDAVDLGTLASAVPQFKGSITGTASGYLVAGWRDGQPILTDGRLEVDPEKGARLRYDVDGLLTRGMAPGSSAYKQYHMAEKAFSDLELRRFLIEVFPEGNTTRPFRLELFGESDQDGTVVPVDFGLNVNVDDTAGLLEILRMMRRGELNLN